MGPNSDQRREPIDHGTLGRVPILSNEDVELAVSATGLVLQDDVDHGKFGYWLNNIVEQTIRDQLTYRLTPKRFRDLRDSIQRYRELSRSLLHSEYPPPLPPLDWMRDVEKWIKEADRGLSDRSSGGAAQNVEQLSFLPKALGLVHAGFGIVPDSSISTNSKDGTGAAFRFIKKTSALVHEHFAERRFSDRVHPDLEARAKWTPVADDALGKRLLAALKYRINFEEWTPEVIYYFATGSLEPVIRTRTDFAWRLYSEEFRRDLLTK